MSAAALVPLAGISVAGASVSAKPQAISSAKYTKVLCASYNQLLSDLKGFNAAVGATPSDSAATFQTGVVTETTAFLDKVAALKTKLAKVYPDVGGGKRIAKIMATDLVSTGTKVSDGLVKFRAADANGVAFQAEITQFEVVLRLLGVDTTDLSKVTDQDVIGAVGHERTCKKIFPVTGG